MNRLIIFLIKIYQIVFSAVLVLLLGRACRYNPTCSDYSHEAIEKHGVVRGSIMSLKRILRCHPWGGQGYDPVA